MRAGLWGARMSDATGLLYSLKLDDEELIIQSVDPKNFSVVVGGDYAAAFGGLNVALGEVIRRMKSDEYFCRAQVEFASDIENWKRQVFDLFDEPEQA